MNTNSLIHSLVQDLAPVSPLKTRNDLLLGLTAGGGVSLVAILSIYGVQPALLGAAHGGPLLVKGGYTLSLAAVAASMLMPLSRVGRVPPGRWTIIAVSALVLAAIALAQSAWTPAERLGSLWLGSSWNQCPFRVATLSIPLLVGLCWAIRRQAPVRLRTAGAVAGLLAGGIAATLYALACTENGAGFVLIWYTLGIALSTALGALAGPRALRW